MLTSLANTLRQRLGANSRLKNWLGRSWNTVPAETKTANEQVVRNKIRIVSTIEEVAPVPRDKLCRALDLFAIETGFLESIVQRQAVDKHGKPIPWMTYPAIDFLNNLDLSKRDVFEYGSGNSTCFWAARAARVVSVEHDSNWAQAVRPTLGRNVTYLLRSKNASYWNCLRETERSFDIIAIDGIQRFECAQIAVDHLKPGGLIVFDNSDWYPNSCAFLRNRGFSQFDFCGFGPINDYGWCTSMFVMHRLAVPHKEQIRFIGENPINENPDDGPAFEV